MAAEAAAVSRALRQAGLRPLPSGTSRMREGMRVQRGISGEVHVSVDIDAAHLAERVADDAADILTEAGYTVRWSGRVHLYVSKES